MLRTGLRANDFLVAESAAMRAVATAVEQFADGGAPVLVCGEHGTGRELVARVLHQRGPRAKQRFIAVRPTFADEREPPPAPRTTAVAAATEICARARRVIAKASGGTLLVKDVSDLSSPSQRELDRAMGDAATDVQVVATADLDLERAVDARIVSRELYARFAPRRIVVPPLRERLEDLPALFERWVKHYAHEIGRPRPAVSSRAHDRLARYPWPGNCGELKAIARRLVVRVAAAKIEPHDVDAILPIVADRVPLEDLAFEDMIKAKLAPLLARMGGYAVGDLYDQIVARVERPLFELVLAHTGGNQLKAAALLGLNRNTLRKKLAASSPRAAASAAADRSTASRDRPAGSRPRPRSR